MDSVPQALARCSSADKACSTRSANLDKRLRWHEPVVFASRGFAGVGGRVVLLQTNDYEGRVRARRMCGARFFAESRPCWLLCNCAA